MTLKNEVGTMVKTFYGYREPDRCCENCSFARMVGKSRPRTHWQPEEYPEFDGCTKGGPEIDIYEKLMETLDDYFKELPDGSKAKFHTLHSRGKFCPMFEER